MLTKLLSFLFLISAGDGDGHKGGSEVLLRDYLRSLGSIQAYQWMTNDIYSLSQTSPSQLNTAALLLEAAKVVREMYEVGGYTAIKALRHYSATNNQEVAAHRYFIGQTVQYFCESSLQNTPDAAYCTNRTAGIEVSFITTSMHITCTKHTASVVWSLMYLGCSISWLASEQAER